MLKAGSSVPSTAEQKQGMNLFRDVEGGALEACTGIVPWAEEKELDKGARQG